jgi:acetate kinase
MVFTGGIGERAAPVRWSICDGLEYLGIKLDSKNNNANADTISTSDSSCSVRVIPTNEDLMIARHTQSLLFKSNKGEAHES